MAASPSPARALGSWERIWTIHHIQPWARSDAASGVVVVTEGGEGHGRGEGGEWRGEQWRPVSFRAQRVRSLRRGILSTLALSSLLTENSWLTERNVICYKAFSLLGSVSHIGKKLSFPASPTCSLVPFRGTCWGQGRVWGVWYTVPSWVGESGQAGLWGQSSQGRIWERTFQGQQMFRWSD